MLGLILAALLAGAPEVTQAQVCAAQAKAARGIMRGRQDGFPAEDAMDLAERAPEGVRPWYRETTLRAYRQDRWASAEMRQRAVEDFGDEAYMACAD